MWYSPAVLDCIWRMAPLEENWDSEDEAEEAEADEVEEQAE